MKQEFRVGEGGTLGRLQVQDGEQFGPVVQAHVGGDCQPPQGKGKTVRPLGFTCLPHRQRTTAIPDRQRTDASIVPGAGGQTGHHEGYRFLGSRLVALPSDLTTKAVHRALDQSDS